MSLNDTPFTIRDLLRAHESGVDPRDTIREVYARIAAADDPALFLHLRDIDDVLFEAVALGRFDAACPLWGVPFVVKDNIDAAGMPTTAACPAYAYTPDRDAVVVARLRAAGAILIGKTNLDQFATGLVGMRSPFGAPRNAVDPEIVPGGSSSGSAVAVGLGIAAFSLGTDTAGSGRVPAALNNIVGLKPTLGALPAGGVVPACRTLDTVSVFAHNVDDAYAVFDAAAGYDPDDAYSRDIATPPLGAVPPGLRIGVPDAASRRFFGDDRQAAMFDAALAHLAGQGVEIAELNFAPFHAVAEMLYDGAWVAERHTVIARLMAENPDALHPVTRAIIAGAETLTADDAFEGFYRLKTLAREAATAMAGIDALCVPTIPTFYSRADLEADPVTPNSNLGTYTNFVNLLDMCAIAVPTAARGDGRPGSVTLLARAGQDAGIAALARLFEIGIDRPLGGTGHALSEPPALAPRPGPGEVTLAVCGAHMAGLPLNAELTSRGARFLRATRTASGYRLYALSGGPPARPGLLRADGGAAIELECWAMPEAGLGALMAGIPAPLGLGTVTLEDGGTAIGFLAEAAGTEGARDITALGGWRAYLAETA